jgi:hypothetical protein
MPAKPFARQAVAILAVVLASTVSLTGASRPADAEGGGPKPTVVLVHGAWADASGWGAVNAATLAQPSGPPGWRTIPSWYLVAAEDQAIPPATERFMAERAGATTREVRSSPSP